MVASVVKASIAMVVIFTATSAVVASGKLVVTAGLTISAVVSSIVRVVKFSFATVEATASTVVTSGTFDVVLLVVSSVVTILYICFILVFSIGLD